MKQASLVDIILEEVELHKNSPFGLEPEFYDVFSKRKLVDYDPEKTKLDEKTLGVLNQIYSKILNADVSSRTLIDYDGENEVEEIQEPVVAYEKYANSKRRLPYILFISLPSLTELGDSIRESREPKIEVITELSTYEIKDAVSFRQTLDKFIRGSNRLHQKYGDGSPMREDSDETGFEYRFTPNGSDPLEILTMYLLRDFEKIYV